MVALDRPARTASSAPSPPGPLEEHFGIRTVDDLLRHYPRSYSHGMSVLDEGWEPPEEGEHVTFVDEIAKADVRMDQPAAQARVPASSPWATASPR